MVFLLAECGWMDGNTLLKVTHSHDAPHELLSGQWVNPNLASHIHR